MHTDAWFAIGDTHLVCEDFALAGRTAADEAYAVVCDGCSSSPETDVGARLLAAAARAELRRDHLPGAEVVAAAARSTEALGLPASCLDATLLVALTRGSQCHVRVFGDGVVAALGRDGSLEVHRFEQPDQAPPYPSYQLDPARQQQWRRCCSPILVEHVDGPQPARHEHTEPPRLVFERDRWEAITLGSDGLDAFVRVHDGIASPVPPRQVLERLLSFSSPRGRFLARRGRRFLRRECAAEGWRPTDDVSLATIVWPEPRA